MATQPIRCTLPLHHQHHQHQHHHHHLYHHQHHHQLHHQPQQLGMPSPAAAALGGHANNGVGVVQANGTGGGVRRLPPRRTISAYALNRAHGVAAHHSGNAVSPTAASVTANPPAGSRALAFALSLGTSPLALANPRNSCSGWGDSVGGGSGVTSLASSPRFRALSVIQRPSTTTGATALTAAASALLRGAAGSGTAGALRGAGGSGVARLAMLLPPPPADNPSTDFEPAAVPMMTAVADSATMAESHIVPNRGHAQRALSAMQVPQGGGFSVAAAASSGIVSAGGGVVCNRPARDDHEGGMLRTRACPSPTAGSGGTGVAAACTEEDAEWRQPLGARHGVPDRRVVCGGGMGGGGAPGSSGGRFRPGHVLGTTLREVCLRAEVRAPRSESASVAAAAAAAYAASPVPTVSSSRSAPQAGSRCGSGLSRTTTTTEAAAAPLAAYPLLAEAAEVGSENEDGGESPFTTAAMAAMLGGLPPPLVSEEEHASVRISGAAVQKPSQRQQQQKEQPIKASRLELLVRLAAKATVLRSASKPDPQKVRPLKYQTRHNPIQQQQGGRQQEKEAGEVETEVAQEGEEGATAWEPECWHEVWATSARDPVTGEPVIVLTQMDVTGKVIAERHLALVMETEHRLVEQLFPRHILQYITEEWTSTAAGARGRDAGGGRGGAGADGGAAAIGGGGSDLASSWRPVVRDCNALATSHPEVTLLFADIRGFTPMCEELEPRQVMALLNSLYSRYDAMLDEYGVYKVETIGDCYFVAGGLIHEDEDGMAAVRGGGGGGGGGGGTDGGEEEDEDVDSLHAERVFGFAQAMLSAASEVLMPTSGSPVEIRIGLHTGPVVSGVVGTRMPRFCLFGDTVNTASRMESTGLPGAIHASEATFRRLPPSERDRWEPTGGIEVKGKGLMQTYIWRPRRHEEHRQDDLVEQPRFHRSRGTSLKLSKLPAARAAGSAAAAAAAAGADAAGGHATAAAAAAAGAAADHDDSTAGCGGGAFGVGGGDITAAAGGGNYTAVGGGGGAVPGGGGGGSSGDGVVVVRNDGSVGSCQGRNEAALTLNLDFMVASTSNPGRSSVPYRCSFDSFQMQEGPDSPVAVVPPPLPPPAASPPASPPAATLAGASGCC
ncbi:hypothetical protein PLESTF_000664200 [Pleodorina starrii]|nr:hypothetical protein PLESTF_000664200 [Pleodorina starrii]